MELEQGSKEWHEARLGKATASKFGDAIYFTQKGDESALRKKYRIEVAVQRLTGKPAEHYSNAYMEWGNDYEELAALEYELRTGNITDKCGFIEHADIAAGASPDRLIGDDGLLEIKCPESYTHIDSLEAIKDGKLPTQYKPQVQGQLWITGRSWCDFASYDPVMPGKASLFIVRVERDEKFIEMLDVKVREFLKDVDETVEMIKSIS